MVNYPKVTMTAEDIARLDANSFSLGIPSGFLMECAGLQATNKIYEQYNLNPKSSVIIMCGLGNNGGDGLCIARHLATRGIAVNVILLGDPIHIRTEETQLNWTLVNTLSLNIKVIIVKDSNQIKTFILSDWFKNATLIIDALLGTGVKGIIREPISSAIDVINNCKFPKISIDVPSGMNPNTGKISNKAVNCDLCISFHAEKIGLKNNVKTWVVPIGIPIEAQVFIGDGDLRRVIKKRRKDFHKGQYGRLLVIGGSSSYSGAPSLAALSALEMGIDLCICLVPKGIGNVVRSFSPNLIVREGIEENLSIKDLDLAKNLSKWANTVLIGPGLGLEPKSIRFFENLMPWIIEQKIPCVVDADGIKMIGNLIQHKSLNLFGAPIILTPHIAELKHIVSFDILPKYDQIEERGQYLTQILSDVGGVFLIKGVYDYIINISEKTKNYRVNRTGCSEMTVGGTGDVLSGITAAFLSLKNNSFDSACSAAYLNGLLGENAKKSSGPRIKATDMIGILRPFLKSKK